MKVSLIVPHYPINDHVNGLLEKMRNSVTGYNELVLSLNHGLGFAKSVNWGLKMAKGDFLAVVSNDVMFQEGNLLDLVDETGVTSPRLNGDVPPRGFWGCCFVLPRWVYEKIGGLDEQFEIGYFEDDDYSLRLEEANIPKICKQNVNVLSDGGQTIQFMDRHRAYGENKEKFLKKWPNAKIF